MTKAAEKTKSFRGSMQGYARGESDAPAWAMPPGFASQLLNVHFTAHGLRSREGWQTITTGLTSSNTYTWKAGTVDVGHKVDFARSDSGKILVFEKTVLYDDDGDTDDFDGGKWIAATASQDFKGGFFFIDTFYVYSAEELYSLDFAGGTKSKEVDFASDIETDYDDVVQDLERYGQCWLFSRKYSRCFYSDTDGVTIDSGAQQSNVLLEKKWDIWQRVWSFPLASIDSVEYKWYDRAQPIPFWHQFAGRTIRSSWPYYVLTGQAFLWMMADDYDAHSYAAGDTIEILDRDRRALEDNTIKTGYTAAYNVVTLDANVTAGDTYVDVDYTNDVDARFVFEGELLTLQDDVPATESVRIDLVEFVGPTTLRIHFVSAVSGSYTTGQNARLTSQEVYKVEFTNNWTQPARMTGRDQLAISKQVWTAANASWYDTNLDPESDDNIDGNIKLYKEGSFRFTEAIRITFTPVDNMWRYGNSGYVDIAAWDGQLVEVVDTRAGLYVFKKNPGSVHLLRGVPGPNHLPGSLEPVFVSKGLTAEPGTIQATRHGVIFGALNVDKMDVYFLPLGAEELKEVPKLTDYRRPVFDNLGDDTYTVKFSSQIVEGDHYILSCTSETTGAPTGNTYSFVCRPYKEKGVWKASWARWNEHQEVEYEDANDLVTISNRPVTIGYYEHNGKQFRVYIVKSSVADEFDYHIASYGWYAGSEAPVDKVYMLNSSDAMVTFDESVWITLESPWTEVPFVESMSVTDWEFRQVATGGDMEFSVYSDFGATADHTETFEDLSDTVGSEQFVRSFEDAPIDCGFFKVKQVFKQTETASPPDSDEYVLFNNLFYAFEPKTSKGNPSEASF